MERFASSTRRAISRQRSPLQHVGIDVPPRSVRSRRGVHQRDARSHQAAEGILGCVQGRGCRDHGRGRGWPGGVDRRNTSVTNLTGNPCITAPAALYVPPQGRGGGGGGAVERRPIRMLRRRRPCRLVLATFGSSEHSTETTCRACIARLPAATDFHKAKPPQFP